MGAPAPLNSGAIVAERLHIDFETYSTLDLKKVGVYAYAEHPSTNVWVARFAFDDEEEIYEWRPGMELHPRLIEHVENGGKIYAWNAEFERVIWKLILTPTYGWPKTKLEQYRCTMSEAIAMSLPRALGQAAKVVGLPVEKDDPGRKLALKMCKPRSTKGGEIVWWDGPEYQDRLSEYCEQDVVVERAMYHKVRRLSDDEQNLYELTQYMNSRGVTLDLPLVRACKKLAGVVRDDAGERIREFTNGAVTKVTQYARLKQWLHDNNVEVVDTTKATIRDLLSDEGVRGPVRQVLEIWADTAKASITKLDAMLRMVNADGRVRGGQIYHGAGTGRWSGAGMQPHNFPRPTIDDVESYIPLILAGDLEGIEETEPAVLVIASLLRGMIVASPGNRLLVADFAQIEARVLAWIAEQEDLVAAFAAGAKVYERMAAKIYGVPVATIGKPSTERDVGKVAVLGCGYQMGWKKFKAQLYKETGIELSDEEAQAVVEAYRSMNAMVVEFWKRIENAAKRALLKPGRIISVGRGGMLRYVVRGRFLWCILPSGRPLGYYRPTLEQTDTKFGPRMQIKYWTRDPMTKKWLRTSTYGGKLTENVVQAMARDLMGGGVQRVEAAGYPTVLTVHDEIVADVPSEHGTLEEFNALMAETPRWAAACPVKVEGYEAERYRK
jgi:DNA polymerase